MLTRVSPRRHLHSQARRRIVSRSTSQPITARWMSQCALHTI